jgi:hypothetical protein
MELKEVLGSDFTLVAEKLNDMRFILDDGMLIPKYRFDEVNARMKEAERHAKAMEKAVSEKEGEILRLCGQLDEIKNGYNRALNILKVKEIFVSGGLCERDYQDLVELILKTGEDDMIALAAGIIKLIHAKTAVSAKADDPQ